MAEEKPVRRFIRMPGVRALEDRLLMDMTARDEHLSGFEAECSHVMENLFGITKYDTYYPFPQAFYDGKLGIEQTAALMAKARAHEAQFEITRLAWDEEKAAALKTLGWDLYDDRGQPLRIIRHVCRIIEAVVKGIAGTAPDAEVITVTDWAERMETEAAKFKKTKRGNS